MPMVDVAHMSFLRSLSRCLEYLRTSQTVPDVYVWKVQQALSGHPAKTGLYSSFTVLNRSQF